MRALIFASILCMVSCQQDNTPTVWVKPDSMTLSCEEYFSYKSNFGVLTNNVWNKHAAKDNDWRQCLEKKEVDGLVQYGWSWSWPFGQRVIYSYPQIKLGSSPWAPEPKVDDRFPLKISSLDKLHISYDVETTTNGQHNLATTLWLTHSAYTGVKSNPSVIAAEIMIWTYSTEKHFNPAGEKHAQIQVDDVVWEVWFDKHWSDTSGVNENTWVNITFRAKESALKAEIDALKLLEYAVGEHLITSALFIADVELGNEIMSGSGMTWVKAFSLDLRKKIQ